ncbi:MAG: hypothetical protein KIT09_06670 [Bryobacteraceae bacterium]|nr:hypothetical protein [Bryobacteraceae bacterium]
MTVKCVGLMFCAAWLARAEEIRIVTVDPGHFHAALLQKEMLPGVSPLAFVYAPLGPDLLAHLDRVSRFNRRADRPTAWKLEIYAGGDFFERMLAERPGNVVVLSGRNALKIDRIEAAVNAGLHVLADKPWILDAAQLPRLRSVLEKARRNNLVAYDAMTQRFEVTCQLQRELVNDRELFGEPEKGSLEDPAVRMASVHYLYKLVAGVPNLRPVWFFDTREQGEGLTDVGTHLVDLVQWILFPDKALDFARDIRILDAAREPTTLTREQLQRVTGDPNPSVLPAQSAALDYFCNNTVRYALRGVHVELDIRWDFEPPPGTSDTELAIFRGSRSRVEVRQGKEENYRPEVYVVPEAASDAAAVRRALERKVADLQRTYPALGFRETDGAFLLTIPDRLRVGHEAHFALLTERFFSYLANPASQPAWEDPNMLAKYYVTTKGVELGRKSSK